MELSEAIYQRRSTRDYSDTEVPNHLLMEILRAAVQAPSAVNQQPWAFGVFRGKQRLNDFSDRAKIFLLGSLQPEFELHSRSQMYAGSAYNTFHGAGTLVVIYAKPGKLHPAEDCCLAAQNLMLAAHGLGLGTCPIGYVRSWFDLGTVKAELGIPAHFSAVFPVVVGYPSRKPENVHRNEPEIVCWMS